MKFYKIFSVAVAALTLFAACEKENHEIDNQNKDKAKPTAAVSIVSAVDDTLTFKVSAAGKDVRSYGYVVLEGTGNPAPSAYEIVVDEVSGAYDSNVFDFADANENEVKIEAPSYGEFEIFAAAITKTGLLGEVVKAEAVVGDETNPELIMDELEYEDDKAIMYLTYSEPVEYVEGKDITAILYAGAYEVDAEGYAIFVYGDNSQKMGTAKAKVSVDENIVTLDFGDQKAGTLYAVTVPDGAFVDMSGNQAKGCESAVTYDSTKKENGGLDGLVGWIQPSTYTLEPAAEIPSSLLVTESDQWFTFKMPNFLYKGDGSAVGTATYVNNSGAVKTSRTAELKFYSHYMPDASYMAIKFKLPVAPEIGESVTVSFPGDVFMDVYGNMNAPLTFGPILFMAEPFKLTMTTEDVIYKKATLNIVPNELTIPYYWSYVEADAVKGVKDEDIYAADLAYYQKAYGTTYSKYGYSSFEELFMDNFCSVGECIETLSDLDPETKYIVYACSVKEDLSMDSELFKCEFTTPAKPAASADYTALIGNYSTTVLDLMDKATPAVPLDMVVAENVVNESYLVCFPSGFSPVSGNYIDYYVATFDSATKSMTLANNQLGSEGYTWNFGSMAGVVMNFIFYNSTESIDKVTLTPGASGTLSVTYPSIPAKDYLMLQSPVYTEDGTRLGYYSAYVFAGGPTFTKSDAAPSAAPASINGTVTRRPATRLDGGKSFTAKNAINR